MNVDNKLESQGAGIYILKGLGISVIITLILLLIFSIILTYTGISEKTIPAVVITITGISIIVASSIINHRLKKNGLLNGGIIGGTYILLLYIVSSVLSGSFELTLVSLIMIIVGIVTGMLGGIIGVNIK